MRPQANCRKPLLKHSRGSLKSTFPKGLLLMAAMKPRTGEGPMEASKEGRSIILRVPTDGGGRTVIELNAVEAAALRDRLVEATQ